MRDARPVYVSIIICYVEFISTVVRYFNGEMIMNLKINGLTLSIGEGEDFLLTKAATLLGISREAVEDLRVIRRSVDARRARPPHFVYLVTLRLKKGISCPQMNVPAGVSIKEETDISEEAKSGPSRIKPLPAVKRPVVVGCGPAGLFASLTLARMGMPVLILERGKAVPERLSDVRSFWDKGF